MKTTALALALTLAALPLCALAESAPATITIDCAHLTMPSQQAVARLTGIDNLTQAYAARTRLMINVQRSCKQAGGTIVLVGAGADAADRRVAIQARR